MRLIDVHSSPLAKRVLWQLLQERDDTININISHRKMPTFEDHCRFVDRRPYVAWYLIDINDRVVGSIYLSHHDEIAIFIFKEHQKCGYGKEAIALLMQQHPRPRYLANINPANARSIRFFQSLGFAPLQVTYELRTDAI